MSNNIYDILSKLDSVAPKSQQTADKQTTYEQVQPRGSIIAGVRSTETNKGKSNEQ